MLSARRRADGQTVLAYDERKENGPFYCLECGKPVLLKMGRNRINHFAHVNLLACESDENESEAHMLCKMEIFEALRRQPNVRNVAMERRLDTNRSRLLDNSWVLQQPPKHCDELLSEILSAFHPTRRQRPSVLVSHQ